MGGELSFNRLASTALRNRPAGSFLFSHFSRKEGVLPGKCSEAAEPGLSSALLTSDSPTAILSSILCTSQCLVEGASRDSGLCSIHVVSLSNGVAWACAAMLGCEFEGKPYSMSRGSHQAPVATRV